MDELLEQLKVLTYPTEQQVKKICSTVIPILAQEPTILRLQSPITVRQIY
jgi:hypothetical protein